MHSALSSLRLRHNVRCTRQGAAEAGSARYLFDAPQVSFGVMRHHQREYELGIETTGLAASNVKWNIRK